MKTLETQKQAKNNIISIKSLQPLKCGKFNFDY